MTNFGNKYLQKYKVIINKPLWYKWLCFPPHLLLPRTPDNEVKDRQEVWRNKSTLEDELCIIYKFILWKEYTK